MNATSVTSATATSEPWWCCHQFPPVPRMDSSMFPSITPLYPQFKGLYRCFWVVILRPYTNAVTARMVGKWIFQIVWWTVSFARHQHSSGRAFLECRKRIQILGGPKQTDIYYILFVTASNFFLFFYELLYPMIAWQKSHKWLWILDWEIWRHSVTLRCFLMFQVIFQPYF